MGKNSTEAKQLPKDLGALSVALLEAPASGLSAPQKRLRLGVECD